jgi:hypothetical protein
VGRASNRKKAQRQAGQGPRQASRSFQADAGTQQAMHQLVAGLQALVQETDERKEREAAVRRTWSGGAEPVPAEARRWPEGSLGDRFFTGTHLEEARNAPSLATAELPDATVIAADPVHWNVATDALVRAVVFDGLGLDHPAVRELLEVLAPIAEAELAYRKAADAAMYQIGTDTDDETFRARSALPERIAFGSPAGSLTVCRPRPNIEIEDAYLNLPNDPWCLPALAH